MEVCILCGNIAETYTTLTIKGCNTINEVNIAFGGKAIAKVGDKVHEPCRVNHVSKNHVQSRLNSNLDNNNNDEFHFEKCCFFCGKIARTERKLNKNVEELAVSEKFMESVKNALNKRIDGDEWSRAVLSRMGSVPDMIGLNIIFHGNCRIGFRTNKPLQKDKSAAMPGFEYKKGFLEIVSLIRAKNKAVYSINDLIDEMNQCSDGNAYSFNQMKANLLKHLGNEIIMSTYKNKRTLVTLQASCDEILSEFYESTSTEAENLRAIEKVSEIIVHSIKNVTPNKCVYPSPKDISPCEAQKFLPEYLNLLLSKIITGHNASLKIMSIGQAIIQSAHRENVMSPLQIALAVQMHYFTGSKFVVNTLNAFGFCSTYGEAKKFELCASIALHAERMNPNDNVPVIKYVADNVDHNLRTLDGKDTFHGMGIISIHPTSKTANSKIPRIKAGLQDVKAIGSVEIIPYLQPIAPAKTLFYRKLNQSVIQDPYSDLDLLYKMSWFEGQTTRPSWSGMMQLVQQGPHNGKATVHFLPIIDMNPTDYTCINSTLHFICKDAEKYKASPTITFDNPLYWKARSIVENEPASSPIKRVVVCLGGFHLKMSFLGTIGHIMAGTGFDVALAQVYAENSVTHMLSGKAYARAVRGYLMVDSALNSIIMDDVLNDTLSLQIDDLLKSTLNGKQNVEELQENEFFNRIKLSFFNKKQAHESDANSRVWLQYMEMIDILRSNIRSERTGNFKLLKETVQRMIAFFAASGHNSYTKAAMIYLQDMIDLETNNPIVYNFFNDGNFVTRRTDRFWAGLADDLVIEQVLMRSLKVSGGLTRGRGMDDAKRSLWLYSLPARADLNNAIQSLTNLKSETSDQHKECGKSRLIRDNKDIACIYNFLNERNPFAGTSPNEYRNIADGIISTSKANVDQAEKIGRQIVQSLEDKNVFEYSFERCKQVIRLSSKNELMIDGEMVIMDPDTLFQRLLLLLLQSNRTDTEKEEAFCYELCHTAASLFDQSGLMREANSSTMLKSLLTKTGNVCVNSFPEESSNAVYVLEGDWLINKVPWKRGEPFENICERYVTYVKEKFQNASIVFDCSYSPSINDEYWLRETKGALGIEMVFGIDTVLTLKKELFIRNNQNKQRFVALLTKVLEANGFPVISSVDNLIVSMAKVAVESSKTHNTVVVGKRAEFIMVLCFYALPDSFSMFCMYEETPKKPLQLFKITDMKEKLGEVNSKHILFVHAMGGCQTTSQMYNISKSSLLNKLDNSRFANIADIFCDPQSSRESIVTAGTEIIVSLYNGKTDETLNKLRHRKFFEKSQRSTSTITCQALPPTEAAAKFHCLRVFYTIQMWMGNKLNPLDYGWVQRNRVLRPVTTNMPSAPVDILSNIRCGCKGDCNSNRCTCYKSGLKCTTACKVCAGSSCSNHPPIHEDSDLEDDN